MRTNIDYSRLMIFRYAIHLIRKLRKVDIGIIPPFTVTVYFVLFFKHETHEISRKGFYVIFSVFREI